MAQTRYTPPRIFPIGRREGYSVDKVEESPRVDFWGNRYRVTIHAEPLYDYPLDEVLDFTLEPVDMLVDPTRAYMAAERSSLPGSLFPTWGPV